jgi:uncharacterized coiled-coil protein SlyX
MPHWQRWAVGVAATVVAGLLIGGFHDYMRLRDEVKAMSQIGSVEEALELREVVVDTQSKVERIREQLARGGRFTDEDGRRLWAETKKELDRVEGKLDYVAARLDRYIDAQSGR